MRRDLELVLENLPVGIYYGIDPGVKGAIVELIKPSTRPQILMDCIRINDFEGYKELFRSNSLSKGLPVKVFCEKEMVTMQMSPSSATTFMTNYGFCLGVLSCLGVEPTLYVPAVWHRILGIVPSAPGTPYAQRKKNSISQMREMLGEWVVDLPDFTVDAYGILAAGLLEKIMKE